jgi:hypothetical protein
MNSINMTDFNAEVKRLIRDYEDSLLLDIKKLKLEPILKKKNTLLGASEPIETAHDYTKWCLDNWLASSKESKFGLNVLEPLVIYVASKTRKIIHTTFVGIDLVVEDDDYIDLIQGKSGPHWGNADQIQHMIFNMKCAEQSIQNILNGRECRFINLCCYGTDGPSTKNGYLKFCGQECWEYLTGETNFYLKLIEPIRNARDSVAFRFEYTKALNLLTKECSDLLLKSDGSMNWDALQRLNSGRKDKSIKKLKTKKSRRKTDICLTSIP